MVEIFFQIMPLFQENIRYVHLLKYGEKSVWEKYFKLCIVTKYIITKLNLKQNKSIGCLDFELSALEFDLKKYKIHVQGQITQKAAWWPPIFFA